VSEVSRGMSVLDGGDYRRGKGSFGDKCEAYHCTCMQQIRPLWHKILVISAVKGDGAALPNYFGFLSLFNTRKFNELIGKVNI